MRESGHAAYEISANSFRATGITTYLKNGGKLEVAQAMAGHEVRGQLASMIVATMLSLWMKLGG